jgi:hypothetical protein
MKSHFGLQGLECIDIYSDYVQSECNLNILGGNDGFCASWTAYICTIILLNKNKSTIDISKYFTLFDIDEESVLSYHSKTFDELKIKGDIEKFKSFYNYISKFYKDVGTNYNRGYKYIIAKNIKLYYFIMFFYKFINNHAITYYSGLFNDIDKDKLKYFIDKFDGFDFDKKIDENKKYIYISINILEIDKAHKCTDDLFEHQDFCQTHKICKTIDKQHKCYKESNEICLEPIDKTKKELSKYVRDTLIFLKNMKIYYDSL